jgi:hypothetical protein
VAKLSGPLPTALAGGARGGSSPAGGGGSSGAAGARGTRQRQPTQSCGPAAARGEEEEEDGGARASGGACPPAAPVRVQHVTSSSNEQALARSLVDNMPGRGGQTVLRVAGPYAAENALLAVALARPLMRAAYGQDLAVLVAWGPSRAHGGAATGLLLSVFRCVAGAYPPQLVLGGPPTANQARRAAYWQALQQRRRAQKEQRRLRQQQWAAAAQLEQETVEA